MNHKTIFSTLLSLLTICAFAQPGTDIYLLDLKIKGKSISVDNPVNITNRKGYDNQPFFHPEKSLIYYVSADTTGETDIMVYDFQKKQTSALTNTPEREYSPTVTPDKQFVSCIIQRSNGAQDLGKYPIDGGQPEVLINNLTVGYHAWASNDEVAIFALPGPFTLHVVNVKTKTDTIAADSIGRSLHSMLPHNSISFVQKRNGQGFIQKYDVKKKYISTIATSMTSVEYDMAWLKNMIVMSDGKNLFYTEPGKTTEWTEIKINGTLPAGNISRMTVNRKANKIAIVVSE
jgi:hypothetical protein